MKIRTVLLGCFVVTGMSMGVADAAPRDAELGGIDGVMPRGTYEWIETAPDQQAESHTSNIIFLNRCKGGCVMRRGQEDSRTNSSSIVRTSTATVSEFEWGDATWNAVVACVTEMYEPFNIEITDNDPGNQSHFEAIVAGFPQDIGMSGGVGGVSPFSCGIINNAITYSFANIYGGSVQAICEVVAQETAHAFGLEHEYHCPDPMTYLGGCGAKRFRDVDAACGEFSASSCDCGGSTQNSVREMLNHFGPGMPTPPTVNITAPTDRENVEPGFVVRADVTDNVSVESVSLYLNNQEILTLQNPPWVFNAPTDFDKGVVNIEVRASDNSGDIGTQQIQVVLGEPCGSPSDCDDGETCVDGRCVPGPGTDGGLGESCDDGTDCSSGLCGDDGIGKYCAEPCDPSSDGCPSGFACIGTGNGGVCWPSEGSPGGGCAVSGGSPGTPIGIAFIVGALLFVGRRRRR